MAVCCLDASTPVPAVYGLDQLLPGKGLDVSLPAPLQHTSAPPALPPVPGRILTTRLVDDCLVDNCPVDNCLVDDWPVAGRLTG